MRADGYYLAAEIILVSFLKLADCAFHDRQKWQAQTQLRYVLGSIPWNLPNQMPSAMADIGDSLMAMASTMSLCLIEAMHLKKQLYLQGLKIQ
jgi:hypothetical protein